MNAGGVLNTCKSNEKLSFGVVESGERVSNAWAIYPWVGDNFGKLKLIPHKSETRKVGIFGPAALG